MTPQKKLKTQKTVLGNAELRWNTVEDLRNLLAEAVIVRGHMVTARALHEHLSKDAWQLTRRDLLDSERICKVQGFRIGSWYCPMMPKFDWRFLEGLTFDEVGFVHCARVGQIEGVARRFYDDLDELVVLELDRTRLEAELVDEPAAEGGSELFPHLYGELPTTAVSAIHRWRRGAHGWNLGR